VFLVRRCLFASADVCVWTVLIPRAETSNGEPYRVARLRISEQTASNTIATHQNFCRFTSKCIRRNISGAVCNSDCFTT